MTNHDDTDHTDTESAIDQSIDSTVAAIRDAIEEHREQQK
jgi:hypothetical protein